MGGGGGLKLVGGNFFTMFLWQNIHLCFKDYKKKNEENSAQLLVTIREQREKLNQLLAYIKG